MYYDAVMPDKNSVNPDQPTGADIPEKVGRNPDKITGKPEEDKIDGNGKQEKVAKLFDPKNSDTVTFVSRSAAVEYILLPKDQWKQDKKTKEIIKSAMVKPFESLTVKLPSKEDKAEFGKYLTYIYMLDKGRIFNIKG